VTPPFLGFFLRGVKMRRKRRWFGLLALLLLLAACGGSGGGAPPRESCRPAKFDAGCKFDRGATFGLENAVLKVRPA
jgi:ABC-type glycerol-3-phosphate transport system substrate-binding protein